MILSAATSQVSVLQHEYMIITELLESLVRYLDGAGISTPCVGEFSGLLLLCRSPSAELDPFGRPFWYWWLSTVPRDKDDSEGTIAGG